MIKQFDNPKAMDLQLFAIELTPEEEQQLMQILSGQGAEGTEPVGESQPPKDGQTNEPLENQQEPTNEEEQEETPREDISNEGEPSAAPQENGKILGKFNSIDDLINAYRNLESFTTQTRQELSEAKQIINQLQAILQAQQNGQTQPVTTDAQNTSTDDGLDNESFMEMFYENPKETVKQIVERLVKPEIEPIKQKIAEEEDYQNWVRKVNEFARKTPDLPRWQNDMKVILQQNPELKNDPNGLEKAYYMAKGLRYQDPGQLLNDEQFINQILQNDDIKSKVIQEYLSKLKKGAPPASIGTGPVAGNIPVSPPKKPSTLEEAANMTLELFK